MPTRRRGIFVGWALLVGGALGGSCARGKQAAPIAVDCRQVDGRLRPFHREFLIDVGARKAWGDRAANGIYEIEVSSASRARVQGNIRSRCPPDDPESCSVGRVVSYDFDLSADRMVQTMRDEVANGRVVETLNFACDRLPLERSLVARKLAAEAAVP